MKLTKKHIGKLFDVESSDGSWAYQLVDIKGSTSLFYAFGGQYWTETPGKSDWRPFKPQPQSKEHIEYGWNSARKIA